MDLLREIPHNKHFHRSETGFCSDANKANTLVYSMFANYVHPGSNLWQVDGEQGKTHSNNHVPGLLARI